MPSDSHISGPMEPPPDRGSVVVDFAPSRPKPRSALSDLPTDAELITRCRAKDPEAWRLLVERYERLVYAVAVRNGLSAEDAADVTQTTFVTLIDSLTRIRDHERLASWLMTVARRQSWRQRNVSRRSVPLEFADELTVDPLAEWDSLTAVHDALAELGGTCRELIVALYFDPAEPSYADIAERMGRSIGGIGPMRGRCLTKLRALLEEEGTW